MGLPREEEPLWANPLLSPCRQLEGLERNETELNTIEAKKLAHRLRAVTDHMEHYFGNDVHITYRLLSRLMAFESRQRGFGLTATQDAHFNEVRPPPCAGAAAAAAPLSATRVPGGFEEVLRLLRGCWDPQRRAGIEHQEGEQQRPSAWPGLEHRRGEERQRGVCSPLLGWCRDVSAGHSLMSIEGKPPRWVEGCSAGGQDVSQRLCFPHPVLPRAPFLPCRTCCVRAAPCWPPRTGSTGPCCRTVSTAAPA